MAAGLTVIVALVGAFIAWLQWATNRARFQMEFYDRKMAVYTATVDLVAQMAWGDPEDFSHVMEHFSAARANADFLFDEELTQFLNQVWMYAHDHRRHRRALERIGDADAERRGEITGEIESIERWFEGCAPLLREKFRPYFELPWFLRRSKWIHFEWPF